MQYPQTIFVRAILKQLPASVNRIIDAPCGDGRTALALSAGRPAARVIGADISSALIDRARKQNTAENVDFVQADIHKFVHKLSEIEVFCLINSLFLLPEPAELLRKISGKLTAAGRLYLILPNPASSNFRRYQKIFPEVNTFILAGKNYEEFFARCDLQMTFCEGLARVPFYGRWDTKLLYPVRDRYLFWLESKSKSEDFGYYLTELKAQK